MNCANTQCSKPLGPRQKKYCSSACHLTAARETPRPYDGKLRALAEAGHSYRHISRECGIDFGVAISRARTLGIRKMPGKSGHSRYLPEQVAIFREMYPRGAEFEIIAVAVNAVPGGYQLRDKKQFWMWAKGLRLQRSAESIRAQLSRQTRAYWSARRAEVASVSDGRPPIQIHLREIYQHAFTLDLPRDKRGDLDALNRAMRRENPAHPGFVLADRKVSRVGLYAR